MYLDAICRNLQQVAYLMSEWLLMSDATCWVFDFTKFLQIFWDEIDMATLAQDSGHVVMQAPMQTPSSSSSGGIPTTSIDSVFLLGETSARMYLNQTTTSNHESTAMQYANYQEPVINHHNHHELTNAIILENHEFATTICRTTSRRPRYWRRKQRT